MLPKFELRPAPVAPVPQQTDQRPLPMGFAPAAKAPAEKPAPAVRELRSSASSDVIQGTRIRVCSPCSITSAIRQSEHCIVLRATETQRRSHRSCGPGHSSEQSCPAYPIWGMRPKNRVTTFRAHCVARQLRDIQSETAQE